MKTRPESLVPILYSADVRKSITYYKEVLGFEETWEWDDPPTFGGVNWGDIRIFFCKQDQGNPGTWLCINLENVDRANAFKIWRKYFFLSPWNIGIPEIPMLCLILFWFNMGLWVRFIHFSCPD